MRTAPSVIATLLLLHYNPATKPDANSHAIKVLLEQGFIEPCMGTYKTTERGKLWVEMICTTPYPEAVWRNPLTGEITKAVQ